MNKSVLVLAGAAMMLLAAAPDPSSSAPLPSPPPLSASADPSMPAATAQPSPAASAGTATPTPDPLDQMMENNGIHQHRGGGRGEKTTSSTATPSPPPDNRKGIDGVWEVQIQRMANTAYEHMAIKQTGTTISGTYLDGKGKKYPLAGSLDGTSVRIVVSLADGSTMLLEAKLDGTTDMLGMFTDAKERVPFTAAYRAAEKWFENVTPGAGGLGGVGGGAPPM